MDELSSRSRVSGRRMATARPVGSVRRSGGSVGRNTESKEVPPARWAGVAFVIMALLATIVLAVLSPSEGSTPEQLAAVPATPSEPLASQPASGDTRVPTAQPRITAPDDGTVTREWDISVTVEVPQEQLSRRNLSLVILRAGEEVERLEQPVRGKPVTIPAVGLQPGENELSAALAGPGGYGPTSEPIVVHQNRNAPELRITDPETGRETFDAEIDLAIASEPGTELVVRNQATKRETEYTVGPSGTQDVSVRLDFGRNRITVTSTSEAGMKQTKHVAVIRRDGRPALEVAAIKPVPRDDLPKRMRFAVTVKDDRGDPIADATVTFSLAGAGWATDSSVDTTDAGGRATWSTVLEPGDAQGEPTLTIEVVGPNGRSERAEPIRIT